MKKNSDIFPKTKKDLIVQARQCCLFIIIIISLRVDSITKKRGSHLWLSLPRSCSKLLQSNLAITRVEGGRILRQKTAL